MALTSLLVTAFCSSGAFYPDISHFSNLFRDVLRLGRSHGAALDDLCETGELVDVIVKVMNQFLQSAHVSTQTHYTEILFLVLASGVHRLSIVFEVHET